MLYCGMIRIRNSGLCFRNISLPYRGSKYQLDQNRVSRIKRPEQLLKRRRSISLKLVIFLSKRCAHLLISNKSMLVTHTLMEPLHIHPVIWIFWMVTKISFLEIQLECKRVDLLGFPTWLYITAYKVPHQCPEGVQDLGSSLGSIVSSSWSMPRFQEERKRCIIL